MKRISGYRLAVPKGCWLEFSLLVALAVVAVPPANAQIEPARVYTGGEVVSDPESGLTVTIPDGWSGQLSPDGESFRLRSNAGGGLVVVLADELTEAEARRQMTQPVDLGEGVVLAPAGPVQEVASGHFSADYSVSGASADYVGAIDVRLTQSGLGVAFILLSPPAEAAGHRESMREFAFSLGVGERARRAPATTETGNDAWEPFLQGMYLARYFTRTGYTESTELWLCSNGVFYYKSEGGGFGGGASGAALGTGEGRWSATGAGRDGVLGLRWTTGAETTLELSYDYERRRVYVNGEHMLQGQNEYCQ